MSFQFRLLYKMLLLLKTFESVRCFPIERCLILGRFLARNSSDNFDFLANRPLLLSTLRHDQVMGETTKLQLQHSSRIHINYIGTVFAFHAFIEDTFKEASCVLLVWGSSIANITENMDLISGFDQRAIWLLTEIDRHEIEQEVCDSKFHQGVMIYVGPQRKLMTISCSIKSKLYKVVFVG